MTTYPTLIAGISMAMVLVGAIFLAISLPSAGRIAENISGGAALRWLIIRALIIFFIIGYLSFDLILFFNLPLPHELVTGGVFLGGALFVFLVIRFTRIAILDRRRAEKALSDSESCFHTIFDSVSEAIMILDTSDLSILGVNEKMCSMFDMTHEEACRMVIGGLRADPDPGYMDEWRRLADRGKPWIFEWFVKEKGGRRFWVEGNAQKALINGLDRLLVSMRDVTGRKLLEERVARLNECFLGFGADHGDNIQRLTNLCGEMMGGECALYNKLDDGMITTSAQWNAPPGFMMTDRAEGRLCKEVIRRGGDRLFCVRDLGQSPFADSDPIVGMCGLKSYAGIAVKCNDAYVGSLCVVYRRDFSPDLEEEKFMGIIAAAIGVEEERRLAEEALYRAHAELESRVRERTAELARTNELLRIDIAERKKTEEALWKSETILRKVFEAIPDMLAVIDRDLRIVHSNWQGGYEYVPEEVRRSSPLCYDAYYPGQGRPCDNCHALRVFRSGMPVTAEKINPRIGVVEVRAFPIYDDSGEVVMVAEYIRDITEERRVEEELRKAHKLESLGVLAGGIAHDFNNLLTGILGNISLAKIATNAGEKVHKRLDDAERAVWRARDLTQQLMTFSKGGAPVKKTAAITQIVRDSASFVLRGSNVRADFSVADDIWPVEVDEGQFSQVINNLIINADQAMEEGGIIGVAIENVVVDSGNAAPMGEGRYVRITISDHGVGIPEENLHMIFDPYFTTKAKGSGLGLATVYSIIRNHDGHIAVDSTVGKGTTFTIHIPASGNSVSETVDREGHPMEGAGRILVMDDEEVIRDVAGEILGHLGYETEVCSDGLEAVELYREALQGDRPFTAVIMDLTVPGGMGGRETMKRLREIDPDVVGVVSSGYCNDPILANYAEYGFSGIVEKPYSVEELGRVLYELLYGRGADNTLCRH